MGELFEYARSLGLEPFASAWDSESLHEVESLNPKYHKVASPFITYDRFLQQVAAFGRHTFISTGGSTIAQIDAAVRVFRRYDCPFTLLHCTSTYPCPEADCNVQMLDTLRRMFNCRVGFSDHSVGILPSIIAAACGAAVIEKHVTWDRSAYGSDQSSSLERRGMELIARYVKDIPVIMGNAVKSVLPGEVATMAKLRWWDGK
jgi:N-acetylneuraminate synthase